MKLSLKAKYLLVYALSPFFTGIAFFTLIGLKGISFDKQAIRLSEIFQGIYSLFLLGFFALILFSIPALITGMCMFNLRCHSKMYQIICSLLIGFIFPFIFTFLIGGFDKDMMGFCFMFGILGAITSFIITLKLIYFPLNENLKLVSETV